MSKDLLDEIVSEEYAKNGFKNIVNDPTGSILYNMSKNTLDELVRAEYAKNGLKNLMDPKGTIAYYMSKDLLDEIVREEYAKNGFTNIMNDPTGAILYNMNKSTLNELIKEDYDKNGFKNFNMQLYYYMSDSLKAELGIDDAYAALNFVNYDAGWFKTYSDLKNNTAIFKFENGIKVTMFGKSINNGGNDASLYIKFLSNCEIELTNGITVEAPSNTAIRKGNNIYTITIGDGDATITQSDGTSSTVPSGAVLDSDGNIVK